MAVDIFKHQMNDETLQGVRALRVYGAGLQQYMAKEVTSALHTQNGDVILGEILWRLMANYRNDAEMVQQRAKQALAEVGVTVENDQDLAAGLDFLDRDEYMRHKLIGEVAEMFKEKGVQH
ncbi:hypothetical protein [Weissella cibaria]|uniref:hypothetical protein n=1 Tax=Weissella cibaria TaxID=137591 RepID=UPI001FD69BCD|nr:hypothetical protein [Weissella cibaria]